MTSRALDLGGLAAQDVRFGSSAAQRLASDGTSLPSERGRRRVLVVGRVAELTELVLVGFSYNPSVWPVADWLFAEGALVASTLHGGPMWSHNTATTTPQKTKKNMHGRIASAWVSRQ